MKLIRYQTPYSTNCSPAMSRIFKGDLYPQLSSAAFFDSFWDGWKTEATGAQTPVDVFENEQNFCVRVELPGLAREDIDLSLEDSVLSLSKVSEGERLQLRSLRVPKEVDQERVSANLEHGILTVEMPKTEAVQPRQITVQ